MTDQTEPVDDPFGDEALSELQLVRNRLAPLGVLAGLSLHQQLALANRVWLFDDGYQRYEGLPGQEGDAAFIRAQRVYQQKTPVQVRRLNRRLQKANVAVKALIDEIRAVRESANSYLAYQVDARRVPVRGEELAFVSQVEQLAQLAHAVDAIEFPPEDASRAPTAMSLRTPDVLKDQAVRALYDLFISECGLNQNEAEVRVAKIGNAFWDWDFDLTEHYDGIDGWKGCDAIRKRLARRKSTTDN